MIGNLKKYIDKASFMEHIDAKLRQNEPYQSRFLWQDGEVFLMKLLEWV